MRTAALYFLASLSLVAVACSGGAPSGEDLNDDGTGASSSRQAGEASDDKKPDECKLGEKVACASETHSASSSSGGSSTVTLYQVCEKNGAGRLVWGECPKPQPDNTPLVLVFDGAPVTYGTRAAAFDLTGNGTSQATDWPTARTPWLAIDRDGNGRIDDGAELFGSMTRLASGRRAANGFEALAELDTNHDGVVSAEDEGFSKLVTWSDADGNRVSSLAEMQPAAASIVRIELAYRSDPRCTNGNCEVERARFVHRDAAGALHEGEVVDIHLKSR